MKSSISKALKPTSGVIAARTITHPPRQKTDSVPTSPQVDNDTEELPSKEQQENISDVSAANKNFIEDSEFLLQASLFLQTAEQQLTSIESSLKRSKYPRKIFSLDIENCDRREYAHQVVEAVLNGHDVKRKEVFSVPARLRKNIRLKKEKSLPVNGDQLADRPLVDEIDTKKVKEIDSVKKKTNTIEKLNFPLESAQEKELSACPDSFLQPSQVHEKFLTEYVPSKETIPENFVTKAFENSCLVDETCVKNKGISPVELIRKKTTIKNLYTLDNNSKDCPKNAVLIKMLSSFPTSDEEIEDDTCPKFKLGKNSLTIQTLPSINIKPELTQETFTQVNIPPSKTLQKEFTANKNISFLEIVFDEKGVERKGQKSSKKLKSKTIEPMKTESPINCERVLQIIKSSDSSSTEHTTDSNIGINHKREPSIVKKQRQFDRGKLDDILNAITEKLVSHIEIPDEILENTIDRLWILRDYLEEVYVNSAKGYRQKVRLNFTSLWLHEIIRLIDNEMKNRCRSLNLSSGISTILQYIISEIQCASSVSQRQSCILAEENGEIRFYCRHDTLIDRVRKSRKENKASIFLKSLNPSKIFSNGIASAVSNENGENGIFPSAPESLVEKHSKFKKNYSNIENAEPNLISRINMPSSDNNIVSANVMKLTGDAKKIKDEETSKHYVCTDFAPEKLAATKVESVNFKEEKSASKRTFNFYGKNKFMNADQRQKVIQKLGEEVKKMLSWHEQFTLSDQLRIDHSSRSDRTVSKMEILGTPMSSSKKLSPVLSTSSKTKINFVNRGKEAHSDTKADFQSPSKIVGIKPDLVPCVKMSNEAEKISSTNSSEDVAYEDDWEEENNMSAKNESEQSLEDKGSNRDSKSVNVEAAKLASEETKKNNQDESGRAFSLFVEKNEDTSASGSKKSQVISENFDVTDKSTTISSEKKSLESGPSLENSKDLSTERSSLQSKPISGNVTAHCSKPNKDQVTRDHLGKNASQTQGSETDVVSDFSDAEGVSVNTLSNNAQNFKKSCVDSEAETVKDLSLLNSEIVDTDSKVTMSLHIKENSYKENDSENVKGCSPAKFSAPSECDSTFRDGGLEVSEFEVTNVNTVSGRGSKGKSNETGNKMPQSGRISPARNGLSVNSEVSMKLSRSCHELAEKVLHIEQMKNDLLKVLIKPENKLLHKVPSIQSLPDTLREKEESMNYALGAASVQKLDVGNYVSNMPNSQTAHDDLKNDVDESANSHQIVFLEDECERSNQSYIVLYETKTNFESESSLSEKSHPFERNLQSSKSVSIESSLNSSESPSNCEIRVKSPTDVVSESNNSQPDVLISRSVSEERVFSCPKQSPYKKNTKSELVSGSRLKTVNCSLSLFDRDVRTEGNGAKSFVQLSNEILNHLKQEAELLAQFDSTTSIHETSSEVDDSLSSAKRELSSAESSDSLKNSILQNENLSSPLELTSDVIDVPFLNSDVSLLDFENLMSELSENIDNKSDGFSGDSVEELFSKISSERYKVDSSKNLDSSIKDVLLSANGDRGNFIIERF